MIYTSLNFLIHVPDFCTDSITQKYQQCNSFVIMLLFRYFIPA